MVLGICRDLFANNAKAVIAAIHQAAAATRNPPLNVADILGSLSKVHLPKFVAAATALWPGST